MLRKPLVILAIALLLVLGTLTLLVPFLHEAFPVRLYLMAMEFETGRALVKDGRWPSRLIERAHGSRWAPRGGVRRPDKSGEMTLATAGRFGGMIVSPVEENAWTSR